MATHLTHFGQQDRCGTCRDSLAGNQGNLREPTAKQGNREELVNTQLALLISRLEVAANAEMIQIHGKHRLGVLLQLRGLRVVIEGKFRDTPNAKGIVLEDARKRVRTGIAHIAAATVYPDKLRTAPTTGILNALAEASLSFRIVTETFESERWIEGTSGSLMECLCRAQVSLAKDDIVEKTARSLSAIWSGRQGFGLGRQDLATVYRGYWALVSPRRSRHPQRRIGVKLLPRYRPLFWPMPSFSKNNWP